MVGTNKDGVDLAQDWYKWRALVKVVMNIRIPQNKEIFLLSEKLAAFRQVLCSTE
jgi:hypothetical protein